MKRFKILSLNYKFLRLSLTNNRLPDNTNSQPRFIIQFSSILCPVLCTLAKLSSVTQNNYSWSQFVSSATFFDVYNCIFAVFFCLEAVIKGSSTTAATDCSLPCHLGISFNASNLQITSGKLENILEEHASPFV